MTAKLRHRRGRALGPRSAKALSNFDSAAPVLRSKRGLTPTSGPGSPSGEKGLSNFDSTAPAPPWTGPWSSVGAPVPGPERRLTPTSGPGSPPRRRGQPVRWGHESQETLCVCAPTSPPIAAGGEPGEEGRYEDRNMLTRTSARAGPRSPSGEGHCLIETVASRRSGRRGGEGPAAPWSPRRRPVVDADRSGGGGPKPRGIHSTLPRRARFRGGTLGNGGPEPVVA